MPAEKTIDLVALGELLIDFTQVGSSPDGRELFERNPGGAPANVLAAATRLGLSTEFVGKVGADLQGAFLRRTLERCGVGTAGLVEDAGAFTTMAFVEVDDRTGDRSFSFARKPGADAMLGPDEVSPELLSSCRVLHLGSISLTTDPARSATIYAAEAAADAGALISYDPNYRADLWSDEQTAVEEMSDVLGSADLLKLSEVEARMIFGTDDVEEAARMALARGVRLVAVTLGERGACLATHGARASVEGFPATCVDATGAGDAFWGTTLAWLLSRRGVRTATDLDGLTAEDLSACGRFACAAAACCVEGRGAIPAMPTLEQVEARLGA